ncbi:MAG: helix-turn-helix domain-containing protein [Campylobacteraceae bacterium]|jgi:hypothetical protein|nr:helix-turn-helix domain-containing protein [Campylobacteraceae bacterium]
MNIQYLRPVIPIKIFTDIDINPAALKLYIYINELSYLGGCKKSSATLAKELNTDERAIRKYLKVLIDKKYLVRTVRKNNERIITLPALAEKPDFSQLPKYSYKDFIAVIQDFVAKNGIVHCELAQYNSEYVVRVDNYNNIRIFDQTEAKYIRKDLSKRIWYDMYKKQDYYIDKYIKPLQELRKKKLKATQ